MRYQYALAIVGFTLTAAENFLPDDGLVAQVEKQIRSIQPTREERRYDLIGWAPDTATAEAAAKKANRPVYLFTYDGNIDTGRC
jgi:hypothetical protein